MATNKDYRSKKGYEDALYLVYEILDQCDELSDAIKHGYASEIINCEVTKIEHLLERIKESVKSE